MVFVEAKREKQHFSFLVLFIDFRDPGITLGALGGVLGDPEGGPVLQNIYVLI